MQWLLRREFCRGGTVSFGLMFPGHKLEVQKEYCDTNILSRMTELPLKLMTVLTVIISKSNSIVRGPFTGRVITRVALIGPVCCAQNKRKQVRLPKLVLQNCCLTTVFKQPKQVFSVALFETTAIDGTEFNFSIWLLFSVLHELSPSTVCKAFGSPAH